MNPTDTKAARPDPISIRLPEALKAGLADAASAAGRSLNAEIKFRLEWSLQQAPELAGVGALDYALGRRLAAIEAWVSHRDPSFLAATTDEDISVTETMIVNSLRG